jgi:hypothetical protein
MRNSGQNGFEFQAFFKEEAETMLRTDGTNIFPNFIGRQIRPMALTLPSIHVNALVQNVEKWSWMIHPKFSIILLRTLQSEAQSSVCRHFSNVF